MKHPNPAFRRVRYLTYFVLPYQSLTPFIVNNELNNDLKQWCQKYHLGRAWERSTVHDVGDQRSNTLYWDKQERFAYRLSWDFDKWPVRRLVKTSDHRWVQTARIWTYHIRTRRTSVAIIGIQASRYVIMLRPHLQVSRICYAGVRFNLVSEIWLLTLQPAHTYVGDLHSEVPLHTVIYQYTYASTVFRYYMYVLVLRTKNETTCSLHSISILGTLIQLISNNVSDPVHNKILKALHMQLFLVALT